MLSPISLSSNDCTLIVGVNARGNVYGAWSEYIGGVRFIISLKIDRI